MNMELVDFVAANEETLDIILDLIPTPVFVKDVQGNYLACNKAFEDFIGISRQKLIGKGVHELWGKEQADVYHAKDRELFENPGKQIYESEVIDSEGRQIAVQFHKATFTDSTGRVAGLLGVIFDRTSEKQIEYKLKQLADYDALTEMFNRRAGIGAIERLLAECARTDRVCAVAMLDIDHFKEINDTHGHEAGDSVLRAVREISGDILREYDLVFRYGGDEFMYCFPDTTIEEASTIADRLRAAFEANMISTSTNKTVRMTVSIGVTAYPDHGHDIDGLVKSCDAALYAAKEEGRNNVTPYPDI